MQGFDLRPEPLTFRPYLALMAVLVRGHKHGLHGGKYGNMNSIVLNACMHIVCARTGSLNTLKGKAKTECLMCKYEKSN